MRLALFIYRTKKRKYATFTIEGREITTTETLKYLGVTLDLRLSFKEHLTGAGMTASKVAGMLTGIMPNIGGHKQPQRALLTSVVNSVILDGASIWSDALSENASYGTTCQKACRSVALKVTRAYCTTSGAALAVIAGIPPIDLIANERAQWHRKKRSIEAVELFRETRNNR